jgi:hypothetical protein
MVPPRDPDKSDSVKLVSRPGEAPNSAVDSYTLLVSFDIVEYWPPRPWKPLNARDASSDHDVPLGERKRRVRKVKEWAEEMAMALVRWCL